MAVNGNGNGGADGLYGVAGEFLPTIGEETAFDSNGIIGFDTFSIHWKEFSDSDALYFDSGEMTIYKETIQDIYESETGTAAYGDWWNLFESVSNDSGVVFDGIRDEDNTTVFDVTMGTSETSAIEAKYNQTDYSISDVSDSLSAPDTYSITGSIGTAFSSVISKAIITSRLPTKFIWNKSHQKPFKEPNKTAIGIPTDDE